MYMYIIYIYIYREILLCLKGYSNLPRTIFAGVFLRAPPFLKR